MPINLPGGGGGGSGSPGPPGPPGPPGESLPILDYQQLGTYGEVRYTGTAISLADTNAFYVPVDTSATGIDGVTFDRTILFGKMTLKILVTGWYLIHVEMDWAHNTTGRRYLDIYLAEPTGSIPVYRVDQPVANLATDGTHDWWHHYFFLPVPPGGRWLEPWGMHTSGANLNLTYLSIQAFKVT